MKRHLFGMSIVYQMEWIDWHKNSSHALAHKCWGRREMRLPNRKKIEIWCPYDSCAYQFTCSYQVRWKSVKGQWSWTSWRNAMHHIPDKKNISPQSLSDASCWSHYSHSAKHSSELFSPHSLSTCRISLQRSQRYTQKHLHPSITTITLSVSCWQQEMPSMTRSQLKIRQLGSVTSLHRHYLNTNNNNIYIDNALWKVTNSTQAKMLRKSTTVSISMGHSINRHFEPHLCDWYSALILLTGWQKGHLAHKTPAAAIPIVSPFDSVPQNNFHFVSALSLALWTYCHNFSRHVLQEIYNRGVKNYPT